MKRDPLDVLVRSVALLLVAWLPFVVLAVIEGLLKRQSNPLLFQLGVHLRWWVVVPLFFGAERLIEYRLARMVSYLRESGIVSGACEQELGRLERRTTAACCSPFVELCLLVVAVATCVGLIRNASDAAGLWHATVSTILARFLFLRWVHRWVFWSLFLLLLSRLKLSLNALHPDRAGGLAVTVLPSRALSLVFLGIGTLFASDLSERLLPGQPLTPHLPMILTYAGLCVALASLPLLSFVPPLVHAKREMLLSYGAFGQTYVRAFAERWLPRSDESRLFGSADIQSLADLGNSHEVVRNMRFVPFPRDFTSNRDRPGGTVADAPALLALGIDGEVRDRPVEDHLLRTPIGRDWNWH